MKKMILNNGYSAKNDRNSGFSLIELMVVVAIIGILTSLAYPSYVDSVIKARRTDGIDAALSCAASLKKLFTVTNTFQGNLPVECGNVPGPNNGLSPEGFYLFNFAPAPSAVAFTINMIPQGSQANDGQCGTLSITNTGLETVSGTGTRGDCWR